MKRKAADVLDADDFENVDPAVFSKRSKGAAAEGFPIKENFKASSFVLTKATSMPSFPKDVLSPTKPVASSTTPRPRSFLQPKSPAAKLNTSLAKSTPLSAPAGRSPTRGSKRVGILANRRRTGGPFSRVDPPSFGLGSAAPFSLDAALKGTIPSYSGGSASSASRSDGFASLHEPEVKSSWFFDIHEDTPEQEMTNLLQHGTCTLDISSDEESEIKASRERAEGRDKENIPPADDVSQTTASRRAAAAVVDNDQMAIEKARGPLVEMDPTDYYPEGCDSASLVIIVGDEGAEAEAEVQAAPVLPSAEELAPPQAPDAFDFATEVKLSPEMSVNALMGEEDPAAKAALLEPMEGTGDSFELWESGSAKDEAEAPARSATPCPETGNAGQEEQ